MLKAIQLFLGVMVFGAFLAGCQSMTGQTTGEYVDDAAVTTAVKSKLANEQVSSLGRIGVETINGVVHLTGVVKSQSEKSEATRLANQVKGVKRVDNALTVQTE
jgi:osmotically-inducible protein OsmY